jgi:hypothetical protein
MDSSKNPLSQRESSINALFASFALYLHDYHVVLSADEQKLNIYYTPLPYDLIDQDLDFNEEYFEILMNNFKNMLLVEAKDYVRKTKTQVSIVKNKMATRDVLDLDMRADVQCVEDGRVKVELTFITME